MNKKGQFFLVAALIIIALIIGFSTIYNSAHTLAGDSKIFTLAHDIKFEGIQIMNYGVFNNFSQTAINKNIKNFSGFYAKSNPDSDILLIYGNKGELNTTFYHAGVESSFSNITFQSISFTAVINPGISYTFNVSKGQNLYVIIKKEVNEERYVSTA